MAAYDESNVPAVSCEDFQAFQVVLKQMRTIDDRLIHALNASIPTASFAKTVDTSAQCKEIYEKLHKSHSQREDLIKKCIFKKSAEVNTLRERRMKDRDNLELLGNMRKQQTQLRLMQNELSIEEVVQDTANKVIADRCRLHYVPPNKQ